MKTRNLLTARGVFLALFVAMFVAVLPADVHGLTPPSESDGPIRLLTCVVTPQGMLEAEVESQSEDSMTCNIRCNYELGERMFSHHFSVTIPGRFQGRIGSFDTSNAKAGNYSGDLGSCRTSSS